MLKKKYEIKNNVYNHFNFEITFVKYPIKTKSYIYIIINDKFYFL